MKKPESIPPDTEAPQAQHIATPENTPVPGGGSWRWSDTAPHWVSNDTPAQPQPAEPTQE